MNDVSLIDIDFQSEGLRYALELLRNSIQMAGSGNNCFINCICSDVLIAEDLFQMYQERSYAYIKDNAALKAQFFGLEIEVACLNYVVREEEANQGLGFIINIIDGINPLYDEE